ncbi:MAG: cell envelope integrity protein CreD [bacterium]
MEDKLKSSIGLRLFVIGVLSLLLLIPAVMIQALISEREQRRESAVFEVSDKWGKAQTLAGPILTIPYQRLATDDKGNAVALVERVYVLPESLSITAELLPERRYRGIYEVILYNARIKMRAYFAPVDASGLNIATNDIFWRDASLLLGMSDLKGIRDIVKIKWNGKELVANPGIEWKEVLATGITVKPELASRAESYDFAVDLNLNGSGEIQFLPVGKETRTTVSSSWNNPSFIGQFLPVQREVHTSQFRADWRVLHLNRNYPQKWIGAQPQLLASAFGVKLLLPIDEYQKTMRTAKYAIMFIALTFLAFFMTEILNKKILHPIQYVLIGLALILFYTLLLSISEHVSFNRAYLMASAAIIGLITAYTKGVLANNTVTAIIAGILIILYGFLFVILQLQDYALLLGSLGLFIILAIVMYLTRKIDWFSLAKIGSEAPR